MTNIEQFTQQLMLAHDIPQWEARNRAVEFYEKLENETPSVLNDGWISVEDRLPEENIRVLFLDTNIGALSGRYLGKHWYLEGEKDKGSCITHWQPLPPPPKGK